MSAASQLVGDFLVGVRVFGIFRVDDFLDNRCYFPRRCPLRIVDGLVEEKLEGEDSVGRLRILAICCPRHHREVEACDVANIADNHRLDVALVAREEEFALNLHNRRHD